VVWQVDLVPYLPDPLPLSEVEGSHELYSCFSLKPNHTLAQKERVAGVRTIKDFQTPSMKRHKGYSRPPSPVMALQAGSQERMAGFTHPAQEGGPGLVFAARQGGSGEVVRATDTPPIRRDLPDELQARGGLQRGRPTARTGGIEASLFVLLGRPARFVRIGDSWGSSSIARHAALIAKNALSGSVVTGRDACLGAEAVGVLCRPLGRHAQATGHAPVIRFRQAAS